MFFSFSGNIQPLGRAVSSDCEQRDRLRYRWIDSGTPRTVLDQNSFSGVLRPANASLMYSVFGKVFGERNLSDVSPLAVASSPVPSTERFRFLGGLREENSFAFPRTRLRFDKGNTRESTGTI